MRKIFDSTAMVYGYRQYVEESMRESNQLAEDEGFTWDDFWESIV